MAAATGIASAESVNVVYEGISGNLGQTVTVSLSGGLFFQDGSSSHGVWAGQLSQSIDGVSAKTYCTELTQWAGSGVFDVVSLDQAPQPGSGMGQTKAEAIYKLFNGTNRGADVTTNAQAAAFQAVLWEIIYDFSGQESDLSVAGGKVQFASGVNASLFNGFKALATAANGDVTPTVTAMVNDTRQDQMRVVPLPGTAAMATLGLFGIASRRRRA
ncbi:MAG: PEP-CTERM sorting domain-containing protein [Phycisphaerales bacterium]|nr:PEP-CTERM sorting domain-containing protein [Phycisphaerales bacterium]